MLHPCPAAVDPLELAIMAILQRIKLCELCCRLPAFFRRIASCLMVANSLRPKQLCQPIDLGYDGLYLIHCG